MLCATLAARVVSQMLASAVMMAQVVPPKRHSGAAIQGTSVTLIALSGRSRPIRIGHWMTTEELCCRANPLPGT